MTRESEEQSAGELRTTTLGLPFPWVMKAHKTIGDRFFFFSVSPCTLALGFEFLRDGFVLLLGPMNIGWASIASFDKRDAENAAAFQKAVDEEIAARAAQPDEIHLRSALRATHGSAWRKTSRHRNTLRKVRSMSKVEGLYEALWAVCAAVRGQAEGKRGIDYPLAEAWIVAERALTKAREERASIKGCSE